MSVFAGNVPTPKGLHNEENVISQDRPQKVREAKESEKRRVQGFGKERIQGFKESRSQRVKWFSWYLFQNIKAKGSRSRGVKGSSGKSQKSEDRSQKTEVRRQKSEVRGQRVRGLAKNKTNQRK